MHWLDFLNHSRIIDIYIRYNIYIYILIHLLYFKDSYSYVNDDHY